MDYKVIDMRVKVGDSAFLLDINNVTILYDTGFGFTGYGVAENIKKYLGNRSLDYILLTHSHYDHALGSAYIKKVFPNCKVVASSYVAYIFTRSGAIKTMMNLDKACALNYGITDYEFLGNELKVDISVEDNDILDLKGVKIKCLSLPGHTKCSFGYYLIDEKLFLANESLGVYDGAKTICPSFLVSVNSSLESIKRVKELDIANILSPHLGLLNDEQSSFFMNNMEIQAIGEVNEIVNQIENGLTNELIIEKFKEKYWYGETIEKYPIDALTLNTTIMINLIKKEILKMEI